LPILIASLSVIAPQLNLTKLELKNLKFGFTVSAKKTDTNSDKIFLASLEFDFFRVQLKFAFRIRPLKIKISGYYGAL